MKDKKAIAQILGENLKRIRLEKGVSRKDLAAAIGVIETAYGAYERGERNLPADKIFQLAVKLKVSVADILGENPDAENNKIFEYRLQRAYKMARDFLDSMLNAKPNFDKEGHIVIHSPEKITYENGVVSGPGDYNSVTFKTKSDFVKVMEQAEYDALRKEISFNQAFRQVIGIFTNEN